MVIVDGICSSTWFNLYFSYSTDNTELVTDVNMGSANNRIQFGEPLMIPKNEIKWGIWNGMTALRKGNDVDNLTLQSGYSNNAHATHSISPYEQPYADTFNMVWTTPQVLVTTKQITYRAINGNSSDEFIFFNKIGEGYKSSTISGRRKYVGNFTIKVGIN